MQRIIHSPNKSPAKCLTGCSHFASHFSDAINPCATAKARNTDLVLFFVSVHGKRHSRAWKESQTLMPETQSFQPQRHSLSVPAFAGLSWQFFSVFLARELEDPSSQPRLCGTHACHTAKKYKKV